MRGETEMLARAREVIVDGVVVKSTNACPSSRHGELPDALATVRQALNDDAVAATMVAATVNTRQAAGESGPAFVKRIVRSWLEEMGR